MNYKNFNSFNINEGKIINLAKFSSFEISTEVECEEPIFNMFPNYKIVIMLNNNRCYVYSEKSTRVKYKNISELETKEKKNLSEKSIISTKKGQDIKNQYEKVSGLKVKDVFIYI